MLRLLAFSIMVIAVLVGSILPAFENDKAAAADGPIIADHRIVEDYKYIPVEYIEKVKTMFLNVPGESHSEAYLRGLELLEAEDDKYQVVRTNDGLPYTADALRFSGFVYDTDNWTGEAIWYTWHAWPYPSQAPDNNANIIKNHLNYCNSVPGNEIAAIGFGWCYDMSNNGALGGEIDSKYGTRWAGSSESGPPTTELPYGDGPWGLDDDDYELTGNLVDMKDYLAATEEYINYVEDNHYDTRVFFTTGPVDDSENSEMGYQREIKQDFIREHFDDTYPNAVLFDYADILTHNNNGAEWLNTWDGHQYPQIHPDNLEGDLVGHIGEAGALRLGKALWWMLARIAGWDGSPETSGDNISVTITNGSGWLSFGALNPGVDKQPELASPSIIITADHGNTGNVTIYLKGEDFTCAEGTIDISNVYYNDTNDPVNARVMSSTYVAWKELAPGDSLDVYHWLTIPEETPAGSYTSTFTYKAQKTP
jgi:hypothetical protein